MTSVSRSIAGTSAASYIQAAIARRTHTQYAYSEDQSYSEQHEQHSEHEEHNDYDDYMESIDATDF